MKKRTYTDRETFKAVCGMPTWEPIPEDVQRPWREHLATRPPWGDAEGVEAWRSEKGRLEKACEPWSDIDKKTGTHGRWASCPFTTQDREAFEAHMLEAHGGRLGRWRSPDKKGAFSPLKDSELGNGFRWRPLNADEKAHLGRWVDIERHADSPIRAQIISLADRTLIGARKAVFAIDTEGHYWVFDPTAKRAAAHLCDAHGRMHNFASQGHGYVFTDTEAAAS